MIQLLGAERRRRALVAELRAAKPIREFSDADGPLLRQPAMAGSA
jgi:hypothetical protein